MTVTTAYSRQNVIQDSTIQVVNSTADGNNDGAAASVGSNGSAFVVYNTDSNSGDVAFDFLQPDGSHPLTPSTVNTTTTGLQQNAQVITLADGSVLVLFEDLSSGTHTDLRARWYNGDGTLHTHTQNLSAGTDDFRLLAGTVNDITAYSITALSSGGIMVAFATDEGGGDINVFTFDENFDVVSSSELTVGVPVTEMAVASGETSGGMVAWVESGGTVKTNLISGTGNARAMTGLANTVDSSGQNADIDLANGGGSTFLLAYTDDLGSGDLRVRVIEDPGAGQDSAYLTTSGQPSSQPSIQMLSDEMWAVSFTKPYNPPSSDLDISVSVVDGRSFGTLGTTDVGLVTDTSFIENESALFAYGPGLLGTVFQTTDTTEGSGTSVGGEIFEVVRTSTGDGDSDTIVGDALKDVINGNGGADFLTGGGNDDIIDGGAGDDRFYGTVDDGDDTYTGGDDTDTLDYSATTLGITGNLLTRSVTGAEIGTDTLLDDFENIFGGSGNDTLTGNTLDNYIGGGLAGADTMAGGQGNDRYIVDNPGDVIFEDVNEGTDRVDASISYTLTFNVEQLFLEYGAGAINGIGNGLANILRGNDSDNELDGKGNADDMRGNNGNDTYIVDDAGDTVFEFANEGTDTVNTFVSFVLPDDVENLTLLADGNLGGTGNSLANIIIGNSGNNTLDGAGGADTMVGGLGDDTYVVDNASDVVSEGSGEGTDQVNAYVGFTLFSNLENLSLLGTSSVNAIGNELNNNIFGNSGNNTLDGLTGADNMVGGDGDDIYVVDNIGDSVSDSPGASGGTDQVNSYVSFVLFSYLENLSLLGTDNINAIGNELNNILIGNSGNNTIDGLGGADTMIGNFGDDIFVVDNVGDTVSDVAGGGTDQVNSYVGFTLFDNLENLSLLGTSDINGIGNALNNVLIGNSGNNTLDGLGGADTMVGLGGNDIYVVDNVGDTVTESAGGGTDQVNSFVSFILPDNVENLSLLGTADINAIGNAGTNVLIGNSGNNILDGQGGSDFLLGGDGDDTYVLTQATFNMGEGLNEGTDQVNSYVDHKLFANFENLTLLGNTARDAEGNELNNVIIGNDIFNQIFGYGGDDTLVGNGGDDFFKFSPGSGHDTITDFDFASSELIGLRDYGFADYNALLAVADDSGGTGPVVFTFNANDSLTLLGVTIADLSAGDFLIT